MRINRIVMLSVVGLAMAGACVSSDPTEKTASDAEALKGAIFTTTSDGTRVNANIYGSKLDVYLDGGPKSPHAAALPDGDYYFMVTDPPGKTLLSTDDISCRGFHVSGGVITTTLPSMCSHKTGMDTHRGGITVQLYPYDDTPNNGDEYKAWVTPVGDYSPGDGKFGFIEHDSKTDNFKVRCVADTCDAHGFNCGQIDDGCGNTLNCGTCPPGDSCQDNVCACTPTTCEAQGAKCGSISDGCGGTLNCGSCPEGDTCTDNQCVCTPQTCDDHMGKCGSFSDGCGGTIECGCPSGDTCVEGTCVPPVCTPKTCADYPGQCGSFSDCCGGTIQCGCPSGDSCVAGACVPTACTPDTCANHNYSCGFLDDGCGNSVCCGLCSGSDVCTNHVCMSST